MRVRREHARRGTAWVRTRILRSLLATALVLVTAAFTARLYFRSRDPHIRCRSGLEEGGVVNLSFGSAAKINDAYPRFLIAVDSIGNTVLAWYTFGPAADRDVRGCLR